jgi:membrane protease YdiL (CAAX protease family)
MISNHISARKWGEAVILALLFAIITAFIWMVFNPWGTGPILAGKDDYLAKIGTGLLLLAAALLARRSKRFEKYWQILFALFVLTVAVSLTWIFGIYLIKHLGVSDSTPAGWALPKLNEFFVIVSVIVIFTLLSGNSLGSIYIQKGNLKLGLIIGLIAFSVFAAGAIPMASLFKAQNLSVARVAPWVPWILIYVLANAALEEMLFRGLFLRKLELFIGKYLSIFLLAFIFTGLHSWVTYTADNRIFLAVTFPLALALGYIMQKTNSVWGSLLLHAGMDILIMIGIFSNLF